MKTSTNQKPSRGLFGNSNFNQVGKIGKSFFLNFQYVSEKITKKYRYVIWNVVHMLTNRAGSYGYVQCSNSSRWLFIYFLSYLNK